MYSANDGDALTNFLTNALQRPEKPEPEGVVRERERRAATAAKGERIAQWRRYAAVPREPVPDATGETHATMRVYAQLSVGDVSEVLGVSPKDVVAFEEGKHTYADAALQKFTAVMRDAVLEQDG